jgi:hypothetical protein
MDPPGPLRHPNDVVSGFRYWTLNARLRLPEEGSERFSRKVANTRRHICLGIPRVAAMFSIMIGHPQALPRVPDLTAAADILFSTLELREVILRHSHANVTAAAAI